MRPLVFIRGVAAGVATLPTICLSDPPLPLVAGDLVAAQIDGALNGAGSCRAILQFESNNYLPITIDFGKMACAGRQVAEFTLPSEAPPGAASIHWLCTGQQSSTCNTAVIANNWGGDVNAMTRSLKGRLGCVKPVTNLLTVTSTTTVGGQAVATVITSVVTSLTTSFSPAQTERSNPISATGNMPSRPTSTSTETCDPITCLRIIPVHTTVTTARTATIPAITFTTTTGMDTTTTIAPTSNAEATTKTLADTNAIIATTSITIATFVTAVVPTTQEGSSTAGGPPLLNSAITATTITVYRTVTLACQTNHPQTKP